MTLALAAACTNGSWQQKWSCGWHHPNPGAAHAGYFFGHSILPWLLGVVIGLFIIVRGRRGHRAVTQPVPARRAWLAAKPVPGRK